MAAHRVSYRAAVTWIAENDDTAWLDDDEPILSVTASMVADLFDKTEVQITGDLRRALKTRNGSESR